MVSTKAEVAEGELERINDEISGLSLLAGWTDRPGGPSMWSEPRGVFEPGAWRYAQARELLERSAPLLTMEQTERRNLILVNPSAASNYATVRTQVLAYQMILPGEHARTHRHSPHAGRLVLDVDPGAYTVVNGMKIPMTSGDVVLTPSWHWHGHGHDGNEAAFWIDFLDVPLVQLLDPMFFEPYPDGFQAPSSTAGDPESLIFRWVDTVARLDAAAPDPDGIYGRRIELGSPALPTIGLSMQRLESGFVSTPFRSTASHQYCVVEGSGVTVVDGREVEWARGDVIAVPSWTTHSHRAHSEATLFAINDEPLQRYCGYMRSEIVR
ncbi:MAG: cupin domain-containing protein [Rhodococcus sp. (in: high G+C Gram-positive bacteria)]|nr:MAG: cupin domain-containing protein [Rhodococcus sp. (in: high G+C Gram-positive bacteria)]